jgi:hypothetical protein
MKSSKIFRGLVICAALGASFTMCAAARAQDSTPVATPIVVKERPLKPVWMKAEVVHADMHTIIVKERDNTMLVHTFTYSEKAQNKMNTILENGGYQTGDKVKIRWMPGTPLALDIKGRPSAP